MNVRRSIFIGDVHGCLAELDELLALFELREGDRLFFAGDFVDRGPDSVGVVRRVAELLVRHAGSAAIAGNHEEKALRHREQRRPPRAWWDDATDADWRFLDGLPLVHHVREIGAVIVHGGFYPRFFDLYGGVGDVGPTWRTDRGKRADRLRRFLRIRQVDADGNMVSLDQSSPTHPHWSRTYDGREGHCFFGHDPQIEPPEPLCAPHATGLDTGCCFGGRLTAAVVEDGTRPADATFVSVAARARYAEPRLIYQE